MIEFLDELITDYLRRRAVIWILLEIIQANIELLPLPVGHGHSLRMSRDAIPQCLHILDLLFDRPIIEARRRHLQRARHDDKLARLATQWPLTVGISVVSAASLG